MRKITRKFTAMSMAVMMAVSFAGCGNRGQEQGSGSDSGETANGDTITSLTDNPAE